MSFIDIPDPNRREEIVADYRRLKRKARDDDINSRLGQLEAEKAIVAKSKPIVESIDKVADKIQESKRPREDEKDVPLSFYDEYASLINNKDHIFGMYKKDEDTFWLGDSQVFIDPDENITIHGWNYGHTRGLWNFLMLNDPDKFKWTDKDKHDYLDIAKRVDLLNHPRMEKISGTRTAKYTWLKRHIVPAPQQPPPPEVEKGEEEEGEPSGGSGIGGDVGYINNLIKRLHLVVAERYAGNVEATTPVIRQILEDLKRVKYLSDSDLANVCKELCIPFGNRETVAT